MLTANKSNFNKKSLTKSLSETNFNLVLLSAIRTADSALQRTVRKVVFDDRFTSYTRVGDNRYLTVGSVFVGVSVIAIIAYLGEPVKYTKSTAFLPCSKTI